MLEEAPQTIAWVLIVPSRFILNYINRRIATNNGCKYSTIRVVSTVCSMMTWSITLYKIDCRYRRQFLDTLYKASSLPVLGIHWLP